MQFMDRVVIGDWSKDGHGLSEIFTFRSTHDREDIILAYLAAVKRIGLALHSQNAWEPPNRPIPAVLDQYEDDSLTPEDQKKFADAGVRLYVIEADTRENGNICPTPQGVATLFLEIVRTEIEDFDYVFVKDNPLNVRHQLLNAAFGNGVFRFEDVG